MSNNTTAGELDELRGAMRGQRLDVPVYAGTAAIPQRSSRAFCRNCGDDAGALFTHYIDAAGWTFETTLCQTCGLNMRQDTTGAEL